MTPAYEYKATQLVIAQLEAAGLYVEIGPDYFSVYKHSDSNERQFDCYINCRNLGELRMVATALQAAPLLAKNPDYRGVQNVL